MYLNNVCMMVNDIKYATFTLHCRETYILYEHGSMFYRNLSMIKSIVVEVATLGQ